jgi:hypothetical protein
VREVRGLRFAFLAFNAVPSPDPMPTGDAWVPAAWLSALAPEATDAVAAARAQADAVIVSVHWGYEYDRRSDPGQRAMARVLLAAGADLVVGHHPHVVQETAAAAELEPGSQGFVAYSLGNLLFDQEQGETRQGLALRAFFDRDGLRAVQGLPVRAGPRPQPDPSAHLSPAEKEDTGSHLLPAEEPAGRVGPEVRLAGEIDLTGDGVPEEVRLEDEQVAVYEGGVEVWRGLPEWRVVDLAVGDPNDDGRGEIVLALWKEDAEGVRRSHPFIIGHRGGTYRVLWGGSALPVPIHRVALSDLDGDGVQELLVLEEQENGEQAVAAWRWHGWGFSLLWRGAPGAHQDPSLLPGPDGSPLHVAPGPVPSPGP